MAALTTIAVLTFALLVAFVLRLRAWTNDTRVRIDAIDRRTEDMVSRQVAIKAALTSATMEIVNTTCISNLGFRFPVFFSGWSIDSFLARFVVQHLLEQRPGCIVELGSGSSTLLIARCRQVIGGYAPRHIVVDHDEKYLRITQELAGINGVDHGIDYLHCPLAIEPVTGQQWYGNLAERLTGTSIDLLIIDGPPGSGQSLSRYPAFPVLLPHMNASCTVILDDAVRDDEIRMARRWAVEHPEFDLTLTTEGHGMAILSR